MFSTSLPLSLVLILGLSLCRGSDVVGVLRNLHSVLYCLGVGGLSDLWL